MAVNPYFSNLGVPEEQELVQDLVDETIKISGYDVYYLPRTETVDPILVESFQTTFENSRPIEAYVSNTDSYASGAGVFISKFGLLEQEDIDLMISRRRFNEVFADRTRIRPQEGDLIYFGDPKVAKGSMISSIFEITTVKNEVPFWQMGRYAVYYVKCVRFTFGHERFNTTIPDVDSLNSNTTNDVIDNAINQALKQKESTLKDYTEKNPFGDF